ncbi:hypothetical protein M1N79_00300 [Dehalococcoidia bacterium]|nr:hypothetical protein [Dehalococcoidia bacterium]
MTPDEPAAHVAEDGRRHALCEQLTGTAERAAAMARPKMLTNMAYRVRNREERRREHHILRSFRLK